jgi:hypothetical protein
VLDLARSGAQRAVCQRRVGRNLPRTELQPQASSQKNIK